MPIFVRRVDNQPINFVLLSIPDEAEVNDIAEAILTNGGIVSPLDDRTHVGFAENVGDLNDAERCVPVVLKTVYIYACIAEDTLLNPREYILCSVPLEDMTLDEVIDRHFFGEVEEEVLPALQPQAVRVAQLLEIHAHGRQYSDQEDRRMLNFVSQQNLFERCRGLQIFQLMVNANLLPGRLRASALYNHFKTLVEDMPRMRQLGIPWQTARRFNSIYGPRRMY